MSRIPFESPDFDSDDLEEFVCRFLNAGISIPVDGPEGVEERKILRAYRSNKTGGVSDHGIDVVAKVEGGETWGFQCKLKTRGRRVKWTLGDSKKVVEEAVYPGDRYFLIAVSVPSGHSREAEAYIENRENWVFWDGDNLSSLFFTRVSLEEGVRILEEFFTSEVAENCYGLLKDEVLISADRFYRSLLNEARPFNHLVPLIGPRDVTDSIHQFVESSPKKVMLISAPGGVGKSRILREFSRDFAARHPARELRFVNPVARDESEKSLGYLLKKNLVVVHEDAHRTETLRPRVLAVVAEDEAAKLILSVRPQGIEAVRRVLNGFGIGADAIEPVSAVRALSELDMVRLAEAVLGPSPAFEPRTLAVWSDRSPLICVVGGNLIRTKKLLPGDMLDSQAFREEVFDRFEQQNLENLSGDDPARRDLLRRLMRTLAVLAPYATERESTKRLAEFLEIRGSKLEEALAELEVAEVVTKTDKGWRVGPDLFADHLVYRSCIRDDRPSAFCDELVELFGKDHFAVLLRNLSEAEWRARVGGKTSADLTTLLWEQFQKKFRKSTFWIRREMLESWSAFSVFLPEKSIELAKMAIILDEAPGDAISPLFSLSPGTHRNVIEVVPGILKPIGIYHLDFQFEVFDLLAKCGRNWSPESEFPMREEDNHPWVVIGKAASFALNRPMDSVSGVVRWLGARQGAEWMSDLLDKRCSFLSVVLRPIFQRAIERTYSEGNSVIFQTIPLSVKNTAPMRDAAFELIENEIVPRSEIAALNVIPALNETAAFYGVGPDSSADRSEWRPVRLWAIGLLEKCLRYWKTPFVYLSVWESLAQRIAYEKDKAIVGKAKSILESIPHDLPLRVAFAILGDGCVFGLDDNMDREPDYQRSRENWRCFRQKIAAALLEKYPENEELRVYLEAFERNSRERGFVPNWGPLLGALSKADNDLATLWIEKSLAGPASFLDHCIGTLIADAPQASAKQKDSWIAAAIQSSNADVNASALGTFRWRDESPGEATLDVLRERLQSTEKEIREAVLRALSEPISSGRAWTLALLPVIPFDDLGESEFTELIGSLVKAVRYERIKISLDLLRPILNRLEAIKQIHSDPYPGFLEIVSELSPRETYELIRRRIERFESEYEAQEDYSFNPVVRELRPWSIPGLETERDFPEIIEFLMEKIRSSGSASSRYWKNLFRAAVLMNNTPLGMEPLRRWLHETDDVEETDDIAGLLNFGGSRLVFREPSFVKEILEKASCFSRDDENQIRYRLLPDAPMRGSSNGKLNSECEWVLDEARKAAAAHADDPVLKPFYDFVIDREMVDRERLMEDYQNRVLAMG